jgi:hypothetical protein
MATIKPALKSLYVTFIQFSLVKSSHRESKKVKNNFNRPNGVVGNFALFIYIVVDFNLLMHLLGFKPILGTMLLGRKELDIPLQSVPIQNIPLG